MTNTKKFIQNFIYLLFAIVMVFMIQNCGIEPLGPIPELPPLEVVQPSQISGIIVEDPSGSVVPGVTVTLGPLSTVTDSDGKFAFDQALEQGSYTLTTQKEGYLPISSEVIVAGEGAAINLSFKIAVVQPPVVVTPDQGGTVSSQSSDGAVTVNIPPGAVTTDTPVSVTPLPAATAPVNNTNAVSNTQSAAGSVVITPETVVFEEPVELRFPLTIPVADVNSARVIKTKDGVTEDLGPATIETGLAKGSGAASGELVGAIFVGGDISIVVTTNEIEIEISAELLETYQVGVIELNDPPGSQLFPFEYGNRVEPLGGYSLSFIEGKLGFSVSSQTVQIPGVKSLTNSIVDIFAGISSLNKVLIINGTTVGLGRQETYLGFSQNVTVIDGTHGD